MRDCPYVLKKPEPRVLLIELGDFAKVFRMYGWVEDYSDEYVARDWLLKNVDERFKNEGIEIPFPTSVEISGKASVDLIEVTRMQASAKLDSKWSKKISNSTKKGPLLRKKLRRLMRNSRTLT